MKFSLVLAFISFSLIGYSQTDTSVKLVNLSRGIYKVKYPASWIIDTSKTIMGADFIAISTLEDDKARVSENVMIQDLGNQNIDLKKYKDISENQFKSLGSEKIKVFESSIVTIDSIDYYKLSYSMVLDEYTEKCWSRCFIKNSKAYLSTFNCDINQEDKYKKLGEEIVNSFGPVQLNDIIKQLVQ